MQFVCALRIAFPEVGLVLSTRESAKLRDNLIPLGITMMSAGSHTEPGGYTGQGREELHITKGGRLGAMSCDTMPIEMPLILRSWSAQSQRA